MFKTATPVANWRTGSAAYDNMCLCLGR